jgi:hypothetical protein
MLSMRKKERKTERKQQDDKISTADQQTNIAFNGFSHIYVPLSFIGVIKCTGEFLPHQRKFVNVNDPQNTT